jgi:hypothetical protein
MSDQLRRQRNWNGNGPGRGRSTLKRRCDLRTIEIGDGLRGDEILFLFTQSTARAGSRYACNPWFRLRMRG